MRTPAPRNLAARVAAKAAAKVAGDSVLEARTAVSTAVEAADRAREAQIAAAQKLDEVKAPIVEAEAEVQVAEDELKAAKAKALRPAMGANIFIDGRFVGQNPQMGCAIGVGQKTVRAELLEAGQVTMVAISNVNVAADTIQEVLLSLEKQKGGLLVINSVQAEVRLDERELDFKKLDAMQVSVGSRKIEAKKWVEVKRRDGSKEWQLFSGKDDIEICRDHVLKVRISEGTNKLNFERLNELGSCRGFGQEQRTKTAPRAVLQTCTTSKPARWGCHGEQRKGRCSSCSAPQGSTRGGWSMSTPKRDIV